MVRQMTYDITYVTGTQKMYIERTNTLVSGSLSFRVFRIMVPVGRKRATCLPRMMQPPDIMQRDVESRHRAHKQIYTYTHTYINRIAYVLRTQIYI